MNGRSYRNLFATAAMVFAFALILCCIDRFLGAKATESRLTAFGTLCHSLPWALIALFPLGVLGRHSRWVYVPLFASAVLIEAAEWFSYINFRQRIGGEVVGLLLGSSWPEVEDFAAAYAVPLAVFGVLLLILFVLLLCGARVLRNLQVSRVGAAGAVLALIFAVLMLFCAPSGSLDEWRRRSPAFNLVIDIKMKHREYERLVAMRRRPMLPKDVRLANDAGVTGVFVLGESSTRNRWSLYGYPTNTTPNLSRRKAEIVAFLDVQGLHSHTWASTIYLLTTKTRERSKDIRYSISQALHAAGCRVSLYSNQARWGSGGGEESFTFACCNPMLFMREEGETNRYDAVLLGYLDRDLATAASNRVVFLHVEGNHFPPEKRYPHDWKPFEDAYDCSIAYADRLIEQVIRDLEARGGASWVVYVSDHGETPSSDHWRDLGHRDLWEIPFVIWTSKEFRARFPERMRLLDQAKSKPLRIDQLLPGLLHFMGVEGLGEDPRNDFLSNAFVPVKRGEPWRMWCR